MWLSTSADMLFSLSTSLAAESAEAPSTIRLSMARLGAPYRLRYESHHPSTCSTAPQSVLRP